MQFSIKIMSLFEATATGTVPVVLAFVLALIVLYMVARKTL